MPPARSSIPSLTGVRGVAALWVFLAHGTKLAASTLHAPWLLQSLFLFNGLRGVDLFFVLSGFILMHVHAAEFAAPDHAAVRRFAITRFFRVYPLNSAILLALLVFVSTAPGYVQSARAYATAGEAYKAHNLSAAGFVQTLLLVQSWTVLKLGEWNIVSWTLSAEVLGYLLFPLLAFMMMRERSAVRCVGWAALSLSVLTVLLLVFHHANNNPTGTFGAVRMFFCFLAGVALHRYYQLADTRSEGWSAFLTIAACLFIAATLLIPVLPVLDAFGFAALVIGLAYRRGPINAILESRAVLFLGKISFSFYLTHFLVIQIFSWAFAPALAEQPLSVRVASLVGVAALCLLLAAGCYRLIERPSQQLGRRLAASA